MAEKKVKDTTFKTSQELPEETTEKKKTTRAAAKKTAAKKTEKEEAKASKEAAPKELEKEAAQEEAVTSEVSEKETITSEKKEAETKPKKKRASAKKSADKSEDKAEPSEDVATATTKDEDKVISDESDMSDTVTSSKKKEAVITDSNEAPSIEKNVRPAKATPGNRASRRRRPPKPYEIRTMKEKQRGARREVEAFLSSADDVAKDTMVGLPSEDVYKENQRFMISEEEREENLYKELIRYQKYGEILWGTLVSIDDDFDKKIVYACVLWNDVLVKIPDYLFIEPTYRFGVTYAKMSEEEKMQRRHSTLSFMLGAKVCFVVSNLDRKLILDRYDTLYNTYELSVEGNRQRAMEIMRDIFFFHENRKDTTRGTQREIKEGDITSARVVQVKEEYVLVECGGVESRIPAALLSARDYYTNCLDAYSPGDMMKVRVKKLYIDKVEHSVHLSLTGQIVNPAKAITNVRVGSTYLGKVVSCNEKQHAYTIMLSNGVPCAVLFEFVFGHIPLVKGDNVRVTVKNIYVERGFVAGNAQKV